MTKRNITVAGIALILLIAIAITIVGGGKASPVSVGVLHSNPLNLEQLDLQQASLDLQLLDEVPAQLTAALNDKLNLTLDNRLNNKLNLKLDNNKLNKLNLKLDNKLNDRLDALTLDSLTADAGGLALQLDLANNSKDGATLAVLGDSLAVKLLNA
jgi:hypothetical protein